MSRDVFADTGGLAAVMVANEPAHEAAKAVAHACQAGGGRLVTTSLILTELVALGLRLRYPRAALVRFVEGVAASDWVDVIHVDAALQAAGWALFRERPDKTWSLVDCVSFVLMEQRGIDPALIADHHFEQAGYTRLLVA